MKDNKTNAIAVSFTVTILASILAAVVYALGGQPQLEGLLLGLALAGFGVGLILWAKRLLPGGGEVQERDSLVPSKADEEAAEESLDRGVDALERRGFLLKMGAAAIGALGVASIFPIRSLGSRPRDQLVETAWADGVFVVDSDGDRIRADQVGAGQVVTVFPEGSVGAADAVSVLIGLQDSNPTPIPGRESWSADGVYAYSKLCTHVGCPVGLYEPKSQQLFCPCHQSVFDMNNGARPTGGPATRALPQLPLAVDENGFLVARGEFSEAPGPGFWSRPGRD